MIFEDAYINFWQDIGASKKMVLSTSLDNIVTSRTMSVVILNEKFYFQTDRTFRKYNQLKGNSNVALCVDNIQIEGYCNELGIPSENAEFSNAYQKHFLSSYNRYSSLENERLFAVTPTFIKRWLYIDNVPYIEMFDITNRKYSLVQYLGI